MMCTSTNLTASRGVGGHGYFADLLHRTAKLPQDGAVVVGFATCALRREGEETLGPSAECIREERHV